ncbi:hypothetical protein HNW77_17085 [Komagataeibacter sp. AV436]|uniref:HTH cro/C1-type domain-containing protein n=1 Tax=Komagataeibacter melomenusus TaxID=2766578 RepID=A0ABX2AKB2_9PROT|nr:hypothetical protein [Komagataeibacter melomenusus]MBV1831891.1 hypothetical protein [Komagataeibacter melomenusus]NPC68049.1 hypothetical protein [Komagataeibacter melomenusus]
MARLAEDNGTTIEIIQEAMLLLGIKNQAKLAEAIGVSRSSINLLMLGKRDMSSNTRLCLISLLNNKKNELLRKAQDTEKMIERLQKRHISVAEAEIHKATGAPSSCIGNRSDGYR